MLKTAVLYHRNSAWRSSSTCASSLIPKKRQCGQFKNPRSLTSHDGEVTVKVAREAGGSPVCLSVRDIFLKLWSHQNQ